MSRNVGIDSGQSSFHFAAGASVFRDNTSCRFGVSGTNDKAVGDADGSDQFWSGSNGSRSKGSRCSTYSGTLGWHFASDGSLVVTFGGTTAPPAPPAEPPDQPPDQPPPAPTAKAVCGVSPRCETGTSVVNRTGGLPILPGTGGPW